ncbi:conserved unknown protein [Ectocarpus siliculosus]|uniref:CRAL-TRIO domain-containing protein n=2 Tax=Ectocarpus siliculosus TaxID=2880 RepID=D7FZM4_ECTSI|nr:conserved unknown protein [Ectocarpus siliculosus]|eukprot:CBJ32831.1 conserved unknown protein [Ectocarpus siliculosus]
MSAPCPRSSSCERCSAFPGSRHFSEISSKGGDLSSNSSSTIAAGLRRADSGWHLGLVLGLLIGGLCYGRGGGGGSSVVAKDGGEGTSWFDDKPAFVACAAACSVVLSVAVVAWRRTGNDGAIKSETVVGCGRTTGALSVFGRRLRHGKGGSAGRKEAFGEGEDGGEEEPLLAGGSLDAPGPSSSASEPGERTDVEAGAGGGADCPVSSRYLAACKGNTVAAKAMWDETVKWRTDTGAERSLSTPQPTLDIIKQCYPYFVHGRSKKGEVVVYEQTGKMQFGRLADAGVSPFDMQMHYAFFNDFVFSKLNDEDDDDAKLMTVLDVGELRLATIKNNTVVTKYLAATAEVMQKHYPERQSRILVVNAPWWFAGIWKGVSGVLSSGTQAKLQIRGKNFLPTLLEHVDASQIPSEYGGDSPQALGESTDEMALCRLAASLGPTSLPPPPEGAAPSRSDAGDGERSGDGSAVGSVASGDGDDDHLVPDYSDGVGSESGVMEEGGIPGEFVGGGGGGGSSHGLRDGEEGSALQASPRPRESSAVSAAAAAGGASRDAKGASFGPGSGEDGDGGERGPSADGGGSTGGLGVTQRFASAVRRMRGGATRAYLGVENKFRYDTARRMWVMEGEGRGRSGATGNDGSGGVGERTRRKDTGGAQDETARDSDGDKDNSEQNLIRAIQAAQQARGGAKSVFSSGANGGNGGGGGGDIVRTWRMDGPPPGGSEGGETTAAVVLALHLVWVALEAATEALLPLWMLSPGGHGGLGFSAADTGVVLAIAVAALALPRYFSPAALLRVAARSPVRTLRAATSVQVIAATFLSGVATSAWTWTGPLSRDATFAAVTAAAAASRAASTMLARPALGNLLSVALGHAGGGGGVSDRHHRRRSADGVLLAVTAGVSQSIGVLAMGVVFSRAVAAGADAGVVSFRLVAAAFVGVYLATLLVSSSSGTAGSRARWRCGGGGGSGGPWLAMCDCVEEATAASTVSSPPMSSYTLGEVWGGDQAGGGWVAGASDLAKES